MAIPQTYELNALAEILENIAFMEQEVPSYLRPWMDDLGLRVRLRSASGSESLEAGGRFRNYFIARRVSGKRRWVVKKFDKPTWIQRFAHVVEATNQIATFLDQRIKADGKLNLEDSAILRRAVSQYKNGGELSGLGTPSSIASTEHDYGPKGPIPLGDVVIGLIFKDVPRLKSYSVDMVYAMAVEAAKVGAAIGMQCPEKVLPIYRLYNQTGAANILETCGAQIDSWIASHAETMENHTLEDQPSLRPEFQRLEGQIGPRNELTEDEAVSLVRFAFLFTCAFGARHRGVCLSLLSAYVNKQPILEKVVREMELFSSLPVSVEQVLDYAEKVVEQYEAKFGPLATGGWE